MMSAMIDGIGLHAPLHPGCVPKRQATVTSSRCRCSSKGAPPPILWA
jgi:hypothetical protein